VKIGELSARTGVPTRMLRYYEEQQLLTSERMSNGYRDYPESAVERVEHIRALISSGVPTKLIRFILGADDDPALAQTCSRMFAEALATELKDLDDRIACLSRSRETVRSFLAATEHGDLLPRPGVR